MDSNLHKQRMYLLIIAGAALISLFLPWFSVSAGGFGSISRNGLNSWGLLALVGVGVVVAACFMGNRTMMLDDNGKKMALAGFGLIAGGALIYMIRVMTVGGTYGVKASPGFGLFIGLIAGVVGLLLLLGIVKMPENKPKI
jgi:hypothetical protein